MVCGKMPLALHIRELAIRTYLRINAEIPIIWDGIEETHLRGHRFQLDKDLKGLDLPQIPTDEIRVIKNDRLYMVDRESYDQGLPKTEEKVQCYTDGSKTKDGVGAAAILRQDGNIVVKRLAPF